MSSSDSSFDQLSGVSEDNEVHVASKETKIAANEKRRHLSDSDFSSDPDISSSKDSSTKKNSSGFKRMDTPLEKLITKEAKSSSVLFVLVIILVVLHVIIQIQVMNTTLDKLTTQMEQLFHHKNNLVNSTRERLNKIECLEQLPEAWLSKWIPEKSKFKGFDEYVRAFQMDRHQILRLEKAKPIMGRKSELKMSLYFAMRHEENRVIEISGPCVYHSRTDKLTVYMQDGNLHIRESQNLHLSKMYTVTYVYRIDDSDLL